MKSITFLLLLYSTFSYKSNAQNIITVAGNGSASYCGDGSLATSACLYGPTGVRTDLNGNIYIADNGNNVIRKVNTSGIITTVAGNGSKGYKGDGGSALLAEIYSPTDVAVDTEGNIYISDNGNNVIRKVNKTGIISTFAGNGTMGYSGDGGVATSAEINYPSGVAVDNKGNVYIADEGNSVIRKVDKTGIITTFAGSVGGYSGDGGPATKAELSGAGGVRVDNTGNVYIADAGNNVIRKVGPSGIIHTIAGSGTNGYSGDGGNALLAKITALDVAVDKDNNVYIIGGGRVRKVDTYSIITTVTGDGKPGYNGDNIPAISAEIGSSSGICVDALGNVYIADGGNSRIRKVIFNTAVQDPINNATHCYLYPNPTESQVAIQADQQITSVEVSNTMGRVVYKHTFNNTKNIQLSISDWPVGVYFVRVNNAVVQKLVKE